MTSIQMPFPRFVREAQGFLLQTRSLRTLIGGLFSVISIIISAPILLFECWIWFISGGYVLTPSPRFDFTFTPNDNPLVFWSGPILYGLAFVIYPTRRSKILLVFLGLIPSAQAALNFFFVHLEQTF